MKCGHIDKYTQRFRWLGLRVTACNNTSGTTTNTISPVPRWWRVDVSVNYIPHIRKEQAWFILSKKRSVGFYFSFIVCFPTDLTSRTKIKCSSHPNWQNDIIHPTLRNYPWMAKKYVKMTGTILEIKSRKHFPPIVFFIHFIRVDKPSHRGEILILQYILLLHYSYYYLYTWRIRNTLEKNLIN